jgi:SpoVK/Ycf46/Vps4 family AAA+-type ATPase
LSEMDGLSKRKGAPFLFIATNRPGDIDDAVCRRLPHSLHIGLPNVEDRKAIFGIYLKEEQVAGDVNVAELAERTKGFSGSDVRTLCVQAALAAERELEDAARRREGEKKYEERKDEEEKKVEETDEKKGEGPNRLITKAHFERALSVTRPTVTREALLEIQKFAAQQRKAR